MNRDWIALIKNGLDAGHQDDVGAQLSPREIQVLELLAKGLSNKQIAHALCITPHTVKAHITRILYKLGVSSRTEAAVIWATKEKRGA